MKFTFTIFILKTKFKPGSPHEPGFLGMCNSPVQEESSGRKLVYCFSKFLGTEHVMLKVKCMFENPQKISHIKTQIGKCVW